MRIRIIFFLLIGAISCTKNAPEVAQQQPAADSTHLATKEKSCCDSDSADTAGLAPGAHTDASIYNLEAMWKRQDGQQIQLGDLGGKVQVITLIYANCQYVCPRIVADMKRIEAETHQKYGEKVAFVAVSIDPDRDTPERLTKFAGDNGLEAKSWTLLCGSSDNVLELAALLGFKYKKISDSDFVHSNMITVLNTKGEIKHQQIGLGTDPSASLTAIAQLLPL